MSGTGVFINPLVPDAHTPQTSMGEINNQVMGVTIESELLQGASRVKASVPSPPPPPPASERMGGGGGGATAEQIINVLTLEL